MRAPAGMATAAGGRGTAGPWKLRFGLAGAALALGALVVGLVPSIRSQPGADVPAIHGPADDYGRFPLSFEPNVGQAGSEAVRFLARGRGYGLEVEAAGARLALNGPGAKSAEVRLSLLGGNAVAATAASDPLPGRVNHYVGDASRWRSGIPTFGRVTSTEVYPGVDVVWYGTQDGELEYDFVVAPGADPRLIEVAFEGVSGLRLDAGGSLVLETEGGELLQRPPVVYQHDGNGRQSVPAGYVLDGNRVRFSLGAHDPSRPLVIDPVLAYSTYLGGDFSDTGQGIAVDGSGNAHIAGQATSSDFPRANAFDATLGGDFDGFVTKLNASGTALVYSTYLGGSEFDTASAVAVDPAGNAYVTGTTGSTDFPTLNAFDSTFNGTEDVFVTKLSPSGALGYSTFLGGSFLASGGSGDDIGNGIAVDSSGSAYVTGETFSNNFPVVGAIQATRTGIDFSPFVTKLSPTGSALVYSTYLPGSAGANSIALDGNGNAVVTGWTFGGTPVVNALQPLHAGLRDGFLTKLSAAGSTYVYSTYLGGDSSDEGTDIAVDGAGSAFVTGWTQSANFPKQNPFDATLGDGSDAFVTKVGTTGSLTYSTFLGGSLFTGFDFGGLDEGYGIGVDGAGRAHVTGLTQSSDFPIVDPIQATPGNFQDVFVSRFNPAGSALEYSTYLGGDGSEVGNDLAVHSGDAYVTGETDSPGGFTETEFPTTPGAFQTDEPGSTGSAFVTKIAADSDGPPPPADFDGDGDTDVAVFRPSNGYWFINGGPLVAWGTSGDIPVPGDYDGDGETDIAVFRPSNGYWFVQGGPLVAWGTSGDIPVPGDYDGDGDTDIAVFRPSTGYWFVQGGPTVAWGTSGDIPVPGDYDGDGDTDIAVFRPSTGYWFVQGGPTVAWGTSGDIPVPGDYDGDGDTDIAVFRPSNGYWFVNGGPLVAFGTSGDLPLPLPDAIRRFFF